MDLIEYLREHSLHENIVVDYFNMCVKICICICRTVEEFHTFCITVHIMHGLLFILGNREYL